MSDNKETFYDILRQSRLFIGLSENEFDLVCNEASPWTQKYEKNMRIWSQGDYIPYIDILESGTITSQKYHLDGRVQIISSFTPPEIINLEAPTSRKKTSPVFVVANTDCQILRINYDRLTNNKGIPEKIRLIIFANIAAYLADDSIRFMYKADVLSRRKVRDRVIAYLNIMRNQTNCDTVNIGMGQEEFANYLSVDRTSLSEALNELKRDNLISFKKSSYTILYPAPKSWP